MFWFSTWGSFGDRASPNLKTMTTPDQLEYSEEQLKRLYEWMRDEKRKPAQTFFTAGWLRNCAREFEYQLYEAKRN